MQQTGFEEELRVACEAARRPGALIRSSYGASLEVSEKGHADLVTEVDREAEAMIREVLDRSFPEDSILGEEGGGQSGCPGRCWTIDPLDGTAGFIFHAGEDIPSVMLSLLIAGVPHVSAIYFPMTDELFHAVKGGGAYRNGERLEELPEALPVTQCWVALNHYGDCTYESEPFATLRTTLRKPGGARMVTCPTPHSGLAVKVATHSHALSAVVHDNHPGSVKQDIWDIAPAQLIVEEAGGCVLTLRGAAYDYASPEPFVIAASETLAREIAALSGTAGRDPREDGQPQSEAPYYAVEPL